ncbi:chromosome partitioning protein ParB [Citrobacter freundii]|uniref:chromosome partitioning protein ParB n=1 Tax=Citrobacter freundii TaxID=546 RepID=UPI00191846D2|nr:chromosome partitioning protein ParB [Citrobacter freundii]
MAANSFKQMSRDGTIKRTDTGMFISLEHIHVREGFNKREDDERTRQADDDLFNYLMNGGTVPPLEVIARDEGGVWVVEGHRRRRCYARCAEAGKPVDRIHIMPFNGNDVQRLARIMTSNNQLLLSDIEQAAVIQELHNAFNQTTSEIAKLVNKSVATVEKLLTLSTANYDVQQEVKSGAVSVDVAVDRVREFGEQAGEVLQHDKAVAAAQGKTKVTRSSIAPKLNIKSARRFVELMAMATISDEGVFTLQGTALAEALAIIDEHKTIAEARETYRLSQPIPTTEIIGKVLYVKLDGKEIGSAIIYRGKNVTLDLGDKKIIASQSKAVAHFVKQHKLQQVHTNANDQ